MRRTIVLLMLALAATCGASVAASAQVREGRGRQGPGTPPPLGDDAVLQGVQPAELQQLFDAYVVMQAQRELQLSDEQFGSFLGRVRTLQDTRRRGQMQRMRMLQELRRLSQAGTDDNQLRTQLKALADLDARVAVAVRQAIEGVDQVLDLRQQARFRLFEEQIERRKVDLLMRARQANRPKNQQQP